MAVAPYLLIQGGLAGQDCRLRSLRCHGQCRVQRAPRPLIGASLVLHQQCGNQPSRPVSTVQSFAMQLCWRLERVLHGSQAAAASTGCDGCSARVSEERRYHYHGTRYTVSFFRATRTIARAYSAAASGR
jgi:hypothetical protein